jgi:DNA-binding MarR family transcriptional regulator
MNDSTARKLHKFMAHLDKVTDKMVKKELGISYHRAVFLITLLHDGKSSQHDLAVSLGYSDPAVSSLLIELTKEKLVISVPDPSHGRKRIVSLTDEGKSTAKKIEKYLNGSFDRLVHFAGIDEKVYAEATDRLMKTLLNYEEKKLNNTS